MLSLKVSLQEKRILVFRHRIAMKMLTPFLRTPVDKQYIFIIGCYGSGTTMLNHLLGFHPEISALPSEGVPLTDQLLSPEETGWTRMVHKALPVLSENLKNADAHRLKKQWDFFHNSSKPYYLEKSISNWMRIPWLVKHFPGAWFIRIVRNGYAVAEGLRRRSLKSRRYTADDYPEGFPIDLCAQEWLFANKTIEEQLKGVSNVISINYEELADQCRLTLEKVLNRLPVRIKTIDPPATFRFHEEVSEISNKNQESIQRLSVADIEIIQSVAGELLEKYQYGTSS